jgi:hypothetical protein
MTTSDLYLLMIGETRGDATPAAVAARLAAERAFDARGAVVDAGRLRPSAEGRRVRAGGVDEGPFDDALARYYLVRADGLDAATALAAECPLADGEHVDVRPLMKGHVPPGKLDQPGKVFAFGVLGAAPDEAAWTGVMDRIDDDTQDAFPKGQTAGGLRLRPPRAGRRITFDRGRKGVTDGPFLEAREVIGGLFFLRMASLEDAIAWAAASAFVTHGTLEIRELWRT